MNSFWATFEPLSPTSGILTLTTYTDRGEWAGSGLVQVKNPSNNALYEEAYRQASFNAAAKGGTLDRFTGVTF